jgi:hypothetical protein
MYLSFSQQNKSVIFQLLRYILFRFGNWKQFHDIQNQRTCTFPLQLHVKTGTHEGILRVAFLYIILALKRHIIWKELTFEVNLFLKSIVVLTKSISNSETMSFYVGASFVIKKLLMKT